MSNQEYIDILLSNRIFKKSKSREKANLLKSKGAKLKGLTLTKAMIASCRREEAP